MAQVRSENEFDVKQGNFQLKINQDKCIANGKIIFTETI